VSLSAGTRLGPYEITGRLGSGGMGEVYRARDTKLNRDVALKVLPDLFANDSERLARFQREAQVLASLNHPNIGGIYGIEETDPSAGSGRAAVRALVLELVEGPTLADRIAQAPAARATSESSSRGARASGGGAPRALKKKTETYGKERPDRRVGAARPTAAITSLSAALSPTIW